MDKVPGKGVACGQNRCLVVVQRFVEWMDQLSLMKKKAPHLMNERLLW